LLLLPPPPALASALSLLGAGGFGRVLDLGAGRCVLKVAADPGSARAAAASARSLAREAAALERVGRKPHVVALFAVLRLGEDGDEGGEDRGGTGSAGVDTPGGRILGLVLERCQVDLLSLALAAASLAGPGALPPSARLSAQRRVALLAEAAAGLAAAHAARVAHGDVKLANLLVCEGGVALADFGDAEIVNVYGGEGDGDGDGNGDGDGDGHALFAADVFALGAAGLELLLRGRAGGGAAAAELRACIGGAAAAPPRRLPSSSSSLQPCVDRAVKSVGGSAAALRALAAALARAPEERPSSAALARALALAAAAAQQEEEEEKEEGAGAGAGEAEG
jgi:serine/threonine protein kinase